MNIYIGCRKFFPKLHKRVMIERFFILKLNAKTIFSKTMLKFSTVNQFFFHNTRASKIPAVTNTLIEWLQLGNNGCSLFRELFSVCQDCDVSLLAARGSAANGK